MLQHGDLGAPCPAGSSQPPEFIGQGLHGTRHCRRCAFNMDPRLTMSSGPQAPDNRADDERELQDLRDMLNEKGDSTLVSSFDKLTQYSL